MVHFLYFFFISDIFHLLLSHLYPAADDAELNDNIESLKLKKNSIECGERNEESRIVGGTTAMMNAYPWMARLSYFNRFYCGK